MKAILIILVIALGALSYKFQLDSKAAQARMIEAESAASDLDAKVNEMRLEIQAAETREQVLTRDLETARSEAKAAREQIALAEAEFSQRMSDASRNAALNQAAADAEAAALGTAAKREADLALLNEQYNQAKLQLADQRAALAVRQEKAKLALDGIKANPPKFSELSGRTDDGRRTGIRTSAADRKEVEEKYQAEIDSLTSAIAAMKGEAIALDAREKAINDRYQSEKTRLQN